ncbi:MAG: molybdenum cofactor synthesis domain-containing protein [Acidobacteriota bacterium]
MNAAGIVRSICISTDRGTPKSPVPACRFLPRLGIEGDGHLGYGHRQVSVLSQESFSRMVEKLPGLSYGAFAENIVTEGIDWTRVPIGRKARFGADAILQVTQHGKVCHAPCAIFAATGECIMPAEGTFFAVRCGGKLAAGDPVHLDPDLERIRFAVITVSDRSAAGAREDRSGPLLSDLVEKRLDAALVDRRVLPDDRETIAAALMELCDERAVDLVLTSGGTGLAPRDVTPEATMGVIDRPIPGMAEAMRAAGLAHTPHAMLSRGICGQRGYSLIVNLSGSPAAVREQFEAVLPALPHAISVTSGLPQDCARTRERK